MAGAKSEKRSMHESHGKARNTIDAEKGQSSLHGLKSKQDSLECTEVHVSLVHAV